MALNYAVGAAVALAVMTGGWVLCSAAAGLAADLWSWLRRSRR